MTTRLVKGPSGPGRRWAASAGATADARKRRIAPSTALTRLMSTPTRIRLTATYRGDAAGQRCRSWHQSSIAASRTSGRALWLVRKRPVDDVDPPSGRVVTMVIDG